MPRPLIPVPVITTSNGSRFTAELGETVLDAALRGGIALEYSCRTGRCSTCKARLRAGSTVLTHAESGLTAQEQEAGWLLTCARSASSDLALEVEDLGNVAMYPARTYPCRIDSLERLAHDVLKVVLRLPPANDFQYHPGQYIDIIGTGGVRRSYSIANAPAPDKRLEVHIREVPGGDMSGYWFGKARPNDLLRFTGPRGTFFLREVEGLDLVFLATGTGIAPIKAMLEGLGRASATAEARSVSVYWGGRVAADLYWSPGSLEASHRFVPVLSRADASWPGARGHVQDVLLQASNDWDRTVVHACGSDAMIHGARERLLDAGLPERRFHSDAFVCSAPN